MSEVRADRPVPGWAAGIIAALSRDRPPVVSRGMLADYIARAGEQHSVDRVASDLQQLGWLGTLHLKGLWSFVPAGEVEVIDPYLDLRGWRLRDDATFALAGEAAAWHLGYLPRRFTGAVSVWVPAGDKLPHGLRSHFRVVRLGWTEALAPKLGPGTRLLRAKGLDLTRWAGGLPGLGPEALLIQIAARPGSFRAWADLIPRLESLAVDCGVDRVVELMDGFSASAWQRAAYLVDRGGVSEKAKELMARRPTPEMPAARLGDGPTSVWSNEFGVNDRLVAPLQDRLGKS